MHSSPETRRPIVVLKLGSSLLGGEPDLLAAVGEIYREVRAGRRVQAAVSAFAGTTDRLRSRALNRFERPHPAGLKALLASGEAVSAAFLALALDEAGIPVALLDPARVGPRTEGPLLDADPAGVDEAVIHAAFAEHAVAVTPGFVGRDGRSGAVSLLGRGGSDLTAIYLAFRLGAEECRLVKDVDGLYTSDPAAGPGRRYIDATWEEALRVGGRLVQAKAVRFAERAGVCFTIAATGSTGGTRVGPGPVRLAELAMSETPAAPRRVILLGLGTVGLGVFRRLRAAPDRYTVVGVLVRDRMRACAAGVPPDLVETDRDALLARPADVVVELIGGVEPAKALIRNALRTDRDVVTANKAVIAGAGPELAALAASRGVALRYSAAVGGAVPMLERVRDLTASGRPIRRLSGVVNGTCNFILDALGDGCSDLPAAVRRAQELGFAEADATLDLSGEDAAEKLAILVGAAFGVRLGASAVRRKGIAGIDPAQVKAARDRGLVLRLVASPSRKAR